MSSVLDDYLILPNVPKAGQTEITGVAVEKYLGNSSVWLYSPPLITLGSIAKAEHWTIERVMELNIDYDQNFLIGDFGIGSEEGILLDCSGPRLRIRILRNKNIEKVEWECPIIFESLADFVICVLDSADTKVRRL